MDCELCGRRNADRRAEVEGVSLNVCNDCVSLGKEMPKVEIRPVKRFVPKLPEELSQNIRPDFALVIRREREKRKLTQEKLAKKLNEKLSIIRRIEEGWEPPFVLIKKLEKFFDIKLLEDISEESTPRTSKRENLTIGDVVEIN